MSTTGWLVGTSVVSTPSFSSAADELSGALGGRPSPFEDVGTEALVDGGEKPVQELLGLVGDRVDPRALAQLERRLLRRRPVAARAGDEHTVLLERHGRLRELRLDRAGSQAIVVAVHRRERGDGAGVARRVAPRPLELRRADDHLVDELGERRGRRAGDEPHVAAERPLGRDRQLGLALVRDADEDVGPRRAQRGLERLNGEPPVCAAWNDVPQPVCATVAPAGSRRSVGTPRSHSGCRCTALAVSPAIPVSIPSPTVAIRAFLFDFDGLILDTETASRAGWQWLYRRHGHELPPEKWALMVGTVDGWDIWGHLEELVGKPLDRDALNAERYAHELSLLELEELRPGIADYLEAADRHALRRAIVSSASRAWVDQHLARLERAVGWDAIVTADHDAERAKPAPTLYQEALRAPRRRPRRGDRVRGLAERRPCRPRRWDLRRRHPEHRHRRVRPARGRRPRRRLARRSAADGAARAVRGSRVAFRPPTEKEPPQ